MMGSQPCDMASGERESSSAEFTSADTSPTQNLLLESEQQATTKMNSIPDEDSDTDVSMSAETDDEEEINHTVGNIHEESIQSDDAPSLELDTDSETEPSKKRKYDSAESSYADSTTEQPREERKRLKPDDGNHTFPEPGGKAPKDWSLLPAEIWHHVFTLCPPRALGALLQVNKAFNLYLDPSVSGQYSLLLPNSTMKLLSPDFIWKVSRTIVSPIGVPAPLAGKSELDMWKIACGSLCQFCNKKRQAGSTSRMDGWHPGPGENGVAPIWSFGIRACGSCLENHSAKVCYFESPVSECY